MIFSEVQQPERSSLESVREKWSGGSGAAERASKRLHTPEVMRVLGPYLQFRT